MAEFIPQIIFMMCMFGYLSLLMWHKWTAYSADAEHITESERCAPSILITFINMVLFKENEFEAECESAYMFAGMNPICHKYGFQRKTKVYVLHFLRNFCSF